ncbi:MAG: hypothetical protein OEY20_14130 [Gemmatimonadota bacterium]|nr:hypothetical protein [Gemmatimonadota bacterium]MDH4351240.1 hypothetical protein [Gemmatimonadota bacterium]MDH5198377.1 hypothetical protein [Gemmatimonadota bacterium]
MTWTRVPGSRSMARALALVGALACLAPWQALVSQAPLTAQREFVFPSPGLGVANAIIELRGGGLAAVGYADLGGPGGTDVLFVRFDDAGDTLWTRSYGGAREDVGWDVVESRDGGFYVVGFTEAPTEGREDVLVLRLDAAGEPQWERTFGGAGRDRAWSAVLAADGGVVIAAESEDVERGGRDAYIMHVGDDGTARWTRRVEAAGDQRVYHIARTSDGAFVATGTTGQDGDGARDVYVVRVDTVGEVMWTRSFGGPPDDVGHGVLALDEGHVLVTGYGATRTSGGTDVYLIRIDASGDPVFWRHHGGADNDRAMMSAGIPGGGVVSVGFSIGRAGSDIVVVESDSAGSARRWTRLERPGDDRGVMILARRAGQYVLAGTLGRSGSSPGQFAVLWLAGGP